MEPVYYEHVVQYYETDRMDCVHHSNYIRWFEEARTYLMDQGGFGYAQMEALGVVSPVLKAQAEYRAMARYGERVIVETTAEFYTGTPHRLSLPPCGTRATGTVRCLGRTEHCFLGEQGRPVSLKKALSLLSPENHRGPGLSARERMKHLLAEAVSLSKRRERFFKILGRLVILCLDILGGIF